MLIIVRRYDEEEKGRKKEEKKRRKKKKSFFVIISFYYYVSQIISFLPLGDARHSRPGVLEQHVDRCFYLYLGEYLTDSKVAIITPL